MIAILFDLCPIRAMIFLFSRILFLNFLWLSLAAFAAAPPTFEKTLANGMKVIVREDHRAPVAVHMVWYRVGAMDEVDGQSGVAHVLEHMMFKSTKHLAAGEFNKRVAEAGGRDNAFTSLDYTAYFQIVPKAALPEMMRLEAERMANLAFKADEFAAEIEVVKEERRLRTEDNPQAKTHEALNAASFLVHPYRRPVIGWMNDLEQMTAEDARAWYRAWYAPNNAILVVVGDVDHQEVFRLAERTYGRLKAKPLPLRKPFREPPQTGPRRIVVKAPADLPYLALSWKVPKLSDVERDREPYALEMLAAILDGNDAARFSRHLVRGSQIAQSAGAGYDGTLRGEAQFILVGQPAAGRRIEELEAALRAEIERIRKEGVSEEELKRARTQLIASQIYKRDSLMAQAMEIGQYEVIGLSWRDVERMIEKLKAVTAEEIRAVAEKYFGDDTLTVAILDPLPLDKTTAKPRGFAGRH